MGLLRISLIAFFACIITSSEALSPCRGDKCGCIFTTTDELNPKDIVTEPLRTSEFIDFMSRMYNDLYTNWLAYVYYKTYDRSDVDIEESGRAICETTKKDILGYWADNGHTLCWVLSPNLFKAECCGETCCGLQTRCEPSVYVKRRYLVYCNYYFDLGNDLPMDKLVSVNVDEFNQDDLNNIERDEGSGERRKRSWSINGYFVFRQDPFPLACLCRTCDW